MTDRKIYIDNLACYRRSLDASKLKQYFLLNNCRIVNHPRKADQIVVLTCAVFKAPEDTAIKRVKELHERYPGKLIVTGCLPGINNTRLRSVYDGPSITTKDINDIDGLFQDFHLSFSDIPDANTFTGFKYPSGVKESLLAFRYNSWSNYRKLLHYLTRRSTAPFNIRISWGCVGSCTYCGIRRAIGKLRSKPPDRCLAELDDGFAKGIRSFPLLGDDIGAYGLDLGTDFPALIEAMLERHSDISITLNDLHPRWLIKYADRLLPHLSSRGIAELWCPVQSGSDRILKLMRRFSDATSIRDVLLKIKSGTPNSLIHSHLICGFPSETEDDWEESLSLIKDSKVDMVLAFPYMKTEGSKAEAMPGHVDKEIVRSRLNRGKRFFRRNNIAALFYCLPDEPKPQSLFEKGAEMLLTGATAKTFGWASSLIGFGASTSKEFRRTVSKIDV